MNVAVVQGRVKGDPDRRQGTDGRLLLGFDVVVKVPGGTLQRVPITWAGVDSQAPAIGDGSMVTVIGHVHRRFYRTGGRTTSRTDVRADQVVRGAGARASKAVASVLNP